MIKVGDQVVCVGGEFSICPYHNEERLGPDPHPEMVGKVYTVTGTVNRAKPPKCSGIITLQNNQHLWCIGCFRKIEKADKDFIKTLFHKLQKQKKSELV